MEGNREQRDDAQRGSPDGMGRRGFLERASTVAMAGGLAGGYGGLALLAGRFLYPPGPDGKVWLFVESVRHFPADRVVLYRTPRGELVTITRRGTDGDAGDFLALSSTCPHLGCRVRWEPHNERFFCPCHNGVFDPDGRATGGPPADAGQSLAGFPLKVENGLLFIEVPAEGATVARRGRDARNGGAAS